MKRNFNVNVTVEIPHSGEKYSVTHTVKAQSDSEARRMVQRLLANRGGKVISFNWSQVSATQPSYLVRFPAAAQRVASA